MMSGVICSVRLSLRTKIVLENVAKLAFQTYECTQRNQGD